MLLPLCLLAALLLAAAAPQRLQAQNSAPDPVLAQDSAPAASSTPGQAQPSAARNEHEEDKAIEEQKELDVFRHAPIVAAIGKKLGLDVETTGKLFEALNFLIIFLAIVIPLAKFLPRILRNRKRDPEPESAHRARSH